MKWATLCVPMIPIMTEGPFGLDLEGNDYLLFIRGSGSDSHIGNKRVRGVSTEGGEKRTL